MLIIGTAGHIDHGKSSIVKRLTNTDPDRLPEEKARGMTIDLGFAFYRTPDEDTIAFVDVPGHERFVKNMVAGVGSIDLVMLVIAADDGWMPQSEEHFQIVRLLKVKQGVIIINKIDLADADWLELLQAEVKEKTEGSFLEKAPIFQVSAQTGEGFEELQEYLDQLPKQIKSQINIGKPRLYIDRSFVRPGIGGVVTGTLKGGEISVGDSVTIFPSQKDAKIRSLHSNNNDVTTAVPGQRTAVSFTGIGKESLPRGAVIIKNEDYLQMVDNKVLALSIEILPNSPVSIEDQRRLLMIIGTTEAEGEIRIYNNKRINPGEKGLIYFKPDEPVYALIGEKWIGRLPTPMVTIGGGQVLDHIKHFPRKKELAQYSYLDQRADFSLNNAILSELQKEIILPKDKLLPNIDFSKNAVSNQMKTLWQKKEILIFEGHLYLPEIIENAVKVYLKKILDFLEDKPHLNGILIDQIADVTSLTLSKTEIIVSFLVANGSLIKNKDKYSLSGSDVTLKGALKNTYELIMKELNDNRYTPPTINNLIHVGKQARNAIRFILDTSQAYKCGPDLIFLTEAWEEILSFIRETLNKQDELTVSDLKIKFNLSRKFTIPILEETDRLKITERKDDVRVKGIKFEN